MSEQLYASFARKPYSLDEVKEATKIPGNFPCHIHIVETKALTAAEYDEFISNFFTRREWLAGKGGTYNSEGRKVVEVTAPNRITLYIDPSGYDYARYVGLLLDEPKPAVTGPKYPHVSVQLVGQDGNAFFILGRCKRAAQRANVPPQDIDAFMKEATAGDYDHLLATCMAWFDCY